MEDKNGFLLLESIITLSIIATLVLILYSVLFLCINIRGNIEDKIELQQQAGEISKHIDEVIGNSKGIISIKPRGNTNASIGTLNDVSSIRCKYKDETNPNIGVKDKEISLKVTLRKIFINTLNSYGSSEPGGYEIGDYIDNVFIEMCNDDKYVNIRLKLSKNRQTYETEFKVCIRNFKGENI